MSWHGYRPTGSRIVAFEIDALGVPIVKAGAHYAEYNEQTIDYKLYDGVAAEPLILTPGWSYQSGVRPRGAPVGIAVAKDGAIWITDDLNAVILRISVDRP
jgi:glucose/arabinose dehydrogenase